MFLGPSNQSDISRVTEFMRKLFQTCDWTDEKYGHNSITYKITNADGSLR